MELTSNKTTANLTLPLPHEAAVIGVTESHGISRKHAVFLCVKSQFIIMSSWVGQSKDWLGRVSSTPILLMLGSIIGVMQSCFKIKHTEATMPKSQIQNPTKANTHTNSVSLKSIFSLLDSNKNPIASSLTFKFQAMVKIGVLS